MTAYDLGSSPLTRGKRQAHGLRNTDEGLIPTHAGKTKGKAIVSFDAGAHPHSRGENVMYPLTTFRAPGSSPLTRGKLQAIPEIGKTDGLIPTHAGKTSRALVAGASPRAHPHSRGENSS